MNNLELATFVLSVKEQANRKREIINEVGKRLNDPLANAVLQADMTLDEEVKYLTLVALCKNIEGNDVKG